MSIKLNADADTRYSAVATQTLAAMPSSGKCEVTDTGATWLVDRSQAVSLAVMAERRSAMEWIRVGIAVTLIVVAMLEGLLSTQRQRTDISMESVKLEEETMSAKLATREEASRSAQGTTSGVQRTRTSEDSRDRIRREREGRHRSSTRVQLGGRSIDS